MRRALFTVAAAVVLFTGCSLDRVTAAPISTVVARWSGTHGENTLPETRIIRSPAEWTALWAQIGRGPPQRFDPAREFAVAVFLGERRSGGYSVEITGVSEIAEGVFIFYREKVPGRDQRVAQMLTSPWTVALFPATTRPVDVRKIPATVRAP